MDIFGLLWIPDFVIWIIFAVVVIYVYGTWPFSLLSSHGCKGPKPMPYIGNIDKVLPSDGCFGSWDLKGKELYGNVYALYEGRIPSIVVFDTDILKHVMVKDFTTFCDRREMFTRGKLRHSLLDLKGDEWRRVRNLQSPFFATGRLRKNTKCPSFCFDNLRGVLDKFAENSESFEVKKLTSAFTLDAIGLIGFGLETDTQNNPDHVLIKAFQDLLKMSKKVMFLMMVSFLFPIAMPALNYILDLLGVDPAEPGTIDTVTEFTRKAIEERQNNKQDRPDYIQAMVAAHQIELDKETKEELNIDSLDRGKGLTEDEIVSNVTLFFLAGYDTVSSGLSFLCFVWLIIQFGRKKYFRRYRNYLEMRTDRICRHDTTVNGYFFPKDTLVTIPIYGLHHDPDIWNDPESFDSERFTPENKKHIDPYAYQPFGMGPRNCLAMRFAQIEIKMAMVMIIRSYKLTVSDKTKLPIKLDGGFLMKAKGGLWLNAEKRTQN